MKVRVSKLSQALKQRVEQLEPEVEYRWMPSAPAHAKDSERPWWKCEGCNTYYPAARQYYMVREWDTHFGHVQRNRLCNYCRDLHLRYGGHR